MAAAVRSPRALRAGRGLQAPCHFTPRPAVPPQVPACRSPLRVGSPGTRVGSSAGRAQAATPAARGRFHLEEQGWGSPVSTLLHPPNHPLRVRMRPGAPEAAPALVGWPRRCGDLCSLLVRAGVCSSRCAIPVYAACR